MGRSYLYTVIVIFLVSSTLLPTESFSQESQDTTQKEVTKDDSNRNENRNPARNALFLKNITGFFLDINAGYNYRFNSFTTRNPILRESPVSYSSLNLGVYDLSVDLGLVGTTVLDFNYESPFPTTNFQQKALEARENRSQGLEKYTAGVNVLPLWRLLIPDAWPDFVKWLPAVEIRYTRELTQNTAIADRESIILNSVNNIDGSIGLEDLLFQRVDEGGSFSFKTSYQYGSVSIPIYVWKWNDMESHRVLRLGVSRWSYSRIYSTRFPRFNTPIVYEADAAGRGLLVSFHSFPRSGFRTRVTAGIGRGNLEMNDRELAGALPFFYETESPSAKPLSMYGEGSFSYRFSFFPDASVTMFLEPGMDVDVFNVSFTALGEVVAPSGAEDEQLLSRKESSSLQHYDFIFLPWLKFSLSL